MSMYSLKDVVSLDSPSTHKPSVDIKDVSIIRWGRHSVLIGSPLNHPRSRLNGKEISSSAIVNVDGDTVETLNTIYKVLSWHKPDGA